MKQNIISEFNEKPKNKSSWYVLWLGITTIFAGPFIGILIALLRRLADPASMNQTAGNISGGMLGVLITLSLVMATVSLSIKKYKLGERSWVLWLGFIPACLSGIFWILFIAGEILFPHLTKF